MDGSKVEMSVSDDGAGIDAERPGGMRGIALTHVAGERIEKARPPGAGPYTCEPCLDVDPMPDYENVLTD